MLQNKGFTLIEMVISLGLTCLLMLAVLSVTSYTSTLADSKKVESSLQSVAVSSIERYSHALQTTGVLQEEHVTSMGILGSIEYTLVTNVTALDYKGAYELEVIARASTGEECIQEVILYA